MWRIFAFGSFEIARLSTKRSTALVNGTGPTFRVACAPFPSVTVSASDAPGAAASVVGPKRPEASTEMPLTAVPPAGAMAMLSGVTPVIAPAPPLSVAEEVPSPVTVIAVFSMTGGTAMFVSVTRLPSEAT